MKYSLVSKTMQWRQYFFKKAPKYQRPENSDDDPFPVKIEG